MLLPFTQSQLRLFNMPEEMYRTMPRISYIVTVCCSMFNRVHPGFLPLYMDSAEQSRSASALLRRLFLENPLIYTDIWPIELDAARRGTAWTEVSFRDSPRMMSLVSPNLTGS